MHVAMPTQPVVSEVTTSVYSELLIELSEVNNEMHKCCKTGYQDSRSTAFPIKLLDQN